MKRNLWVDILRLAMAFLIVALHGFALTGADGAILYVFREGITRLGVPVFLLISGYYFHGVASPRRARTWIAKLCVLYVVWFAIYACLWFDQPPGAIVRSFVTGYSHLWYLTHSAAAFALLWILRGRPKTLSALFVLCALGGIVVQYGAAYGMWPERLYTYRNALLMCFPFIYMGYATAGRRIERTVRRPGVLVALGLALLVAESLTNYLFSGARFDILVSLYVVAPLLLIAALRGKRLTDSKTVAHYSTGVYLIHMIFITLGHEIGLLPPAANVILAFVLSLLATWPLIGLNKKVKWLM